MFWIDKHNKRKRRRGHRIVNAFLCKAWNEAEQRYINCTYASFKRDGRMEKLLHEEQHGFCCYCMRHLEVGRHTSLEHVLPHHCKDKKGKLDWSKINYYKRFNKNFKKVVYLHFGDSTCRKHIGPPYPHFCAYENLVLSCDGSLFIDDDKRQGLYASKIHLCCNEHRGDKQIVPLFFLPDVKDLIEYKHDGTISISENVKSPLRQIELSDTIDALALEHERLQIIRQVWYFIAFSDLYKIEQVKNAISDKDLRVQILADCGIPMHLAKRVDSALYWSLLCEYYWFFNYFRREKAAEQ